MRIPRSAAIAIAVVVTLTSIELTPASAASANGRTQATQPSTIDLSARRRGHRGNAAAFAAIVGVFGTIAAVAAANRHRDRYYHYTDQPYYGSYEYGPYGGFNGVYAYGNGGPYGYSRPYGFQRWHRHHH
jgi:hypothetical protein